MLKLPDKKYNDESDDENEGSVEKEHENDLNMIIFPNVDEP